MTHPRPPRTPRITLPTIAALLAAALGACGDSTPLDQQVRRASDELLAIASALPVSEARDARYSRLVNDLRGALSDAGSDDPAAPAANALLAQAVMGQGAVAENRVRELAGRLSFDAISARSMMDLADREQSLVRALRSFDAAPELAEYGDEATAHRATAAESDRALRALDAETADLEAQAENQSRLAAAAREREAEIRLRAADADPVRRAELIAEATERRREAERHERREAELDIAIDARREAMTSIRRVMEQAEGRVRLADEAAERTRTVDEFMDGQASELARNADARVEALRARLDALVALADGDLAEAYEGAMSRYRTALNHARSADSAISAGLSGSVNARIARMNAAVAESLERLAMLLDRSASLGGAGAVDHASPLWARVAELRDEAASAFEQAASGVSRAGSRGAADAAEAAARSFEASARKLRGEPEEPPADGDDADAGA
jgi:hypothetical protein